MNLSLSIAFVFLTTLALCGQEKLYSISDRQEQMQKLVWMVGQWEGSGWIDRGKEGRCKISYRQTIRAKQNRLVLVLDGEATRVGNAASECSVLRLLSFPSGDEYIRWQDFSSEKGTIRMNEVHADGRSLEVGFPPLNEELARVGAGIFRKELPVSVEGWIRIKISLNDKSEWRETWEMRCLTAEGEDWLKIFEVSLKRVTGQAAPAGRHSP